MCEATVELPAIVLVLVCGAVIYLKTLEFYGYRNMMVTRGEDTTAGGATTARIPDRDRSFIGWIRAKMLLAAAQPDTAGGSDRRRLLVSGAGPTTVSGRGGAPDSGPGPHLEGSMFAHLEGLPG